MSSNWYNQNLTPVLDTKMGNTRLKSKEETLTLDKLAMCRTEILLPDSINTEQNRIWTELQIELLTQALDLKALDFKEQMLKVNGTGRNSRNKERK